jgi:ABC-type amino acid transport substrate-binding protein
VLGTCAVTGTLRFDARKIMRFAIVTIVLAGVVVGGTRLLLTVALRQPYDKDVLLTSMKPLRDRGPIRFFKAGDVVPKLAPAGTSLLDRARSRGTLRIGYLADSLPYAFVNRRGDLVGLDVEMGTQLARDLGLAVEFVPVDREILNGGLDPAVCDLVMSGVVVTLDRSAYLQFSSPYLDETVAFVVPDRSASAFSEWATVRAMGKLRIGVPRAPYFLRKVREELPEADIVPIDSLDDMFEPHNPPVDAFVATAERGSAYTLLHPAFAVAVPKPRPVRVPLAYVIAGRDASMATIVNTWIDQKKRDGTLDELFAHWILGQDLTEKRPRWSIMRDVLHWSF